MPRKKQVVETNESEFANENQMDHMRKLLAQGTEINTNPFYAPKESSEGQYPFKIKSIITQNNQKVLTMDVYIQTWKYTPEESHDASLAPDEYKCDELVGYIEVTNTEVSCCIFNEKTQEFDFEIYHSVYSMSEDHRRCRIPKAQDALTAMCNFLLLEYERQQTTARQKEAKKK